MSVVVAITEAVVGSLNSATFSMPFTAVRTYLPQYKLAEMQTLRVTVVPRSAVLSSVDRSRSQTDLAVDIAIQKKYALGTNPELDLLTSLVEEILEHTRTHRQLDGLPQVHWIKSEVTALYAPDHMEKFRQFTSVLTATYRVVS
ncbi:MAG: hypothetical protein RLZZ232_1366 [Planctomycetota bacterium]|jgi:hypothetical protein